MRDPWRLGFLSVSLTIMSPVPKIVSDTREVINKYLLKGKKVTTGKNFLKLYHWDFPGGTVARNPPARAGDMGSICGPSRFHVPQRN